MTDSVYLQKSDPLKREKKDEERSRKLRKKWRSNGLRGRRRSLKKRSNSKNKLVMHPESAQRAVDRLRGGQTREVVANTVENGATGEKTRRGCPENGFLSGHAADLTSTTALVAGAQHMSR